MSAERLDPGLKTWLEGGRRAARAQIGEDIRRNADRPHGESESHSGIENFLPFSELDRTPLIVSYGDDGEVPINNNAPSGPVQEAVHMRAPKIWIVAALLASPAYGDRRMADACVADLSVDSKAIYAAAVGKMRRYADNEALVRAIP